MYTKRGLIISSLIVLMISITIGLWGADSSIKAQLQNAVGKDPCCGGVSEAECGGPEYGCASCQDGDPPSDCPIEADTLFDDTYDYCVGSDPYKIKRITINRPAAGVYECIYGVKYC